MSRPEATGETRLRRIAAHIQALAADTEAAMSTLHTMTAAESDAWDACAEEAAAQGLRLSFRRREGHEEAWAVAYAPEPLTYEHGFSSERTDVDLLAVIAATHGALLARRGGDAE